MNSIGWNSSGFIPILAVIFTSPILQHHQVVTVHDFAAVVAAERLLDAVRAQAADAHDLVGAVVRDAAGDAPPVAVDDGHGLAAQKGALHVLYARRQQAAPVIAQHLRRAAVHDDAPLHR